MPLIGAAQTEYMISEFQSFEKIKESVFEKNYYHFAVFDLEENQSSADLKTDESDNESNEDSDNESDEDSDNESADNESDDISDNESDKDSDNPFFAYMALKPDERGVFLSKIYVKKEARNRGIAKMMMDFALDFTKEEIRKKEKKNPETKGKKSKPNRFSLWLTVNKGNINSIEFYKKRGFAVEKEMKTDIGNGFYMDDYLMAYYLDERSF